MFLLYSECVPYRIPIGGGREGEGVLIAFVLCFKCMHIVIILEEEEEGRGNECIWHILWHSSCNPIAFLLEEEVGKGGRDFVLHSYFIAIACLLYSHLGRGGGFVLYPFYDHIVFILEDEKGGGKKFTWHCYCIIFALHLFF